MGKRILCKSLWSSADSFPLFWCPFSLAISMSPSTLKPADTRIALTHECIKPWKQNYFSVFIRWGSRCYIIRSLNRSLLTDLLCQDQKNRINSSPARYGSLRHSSVITNITRLPLISDFSFQIKLVFIYGNIQYLISMYHKWKLVINSHPKFKIMKLVWPIFLKQESHVLYKVCLHRFCLQAYKLFQFSVQNNVE